MDQARDRRGAPGTPRRGLASLNRPGIEFGAQLCAGVREPAPNLDVRPTTPVPRPRKVGRTARPAADPLAPGQVRRLAGSPGQGRP